MAEQCDDLGEFAAPAHTAPGRPVGAAGGSAAMRKPVWPVELCGVSELRAATR